MNNSVNFRSLIETFLGPYKGVKCVMDESEVQFLSCPVSSLQAISLKNPIDHVICASLQAQHDSYGCGTNTLLAIWYFWHQQFKELLEKGHQLNRILDIARKALDHILYEISSLKVSIISLLQLINDQLQKYLKSLSLKQISSNSGCYKIPSYLESQKHPNQPKPFSMGKKDISRTILRSRHFSSFCMEASVHSSVDNKVVIDEDLPLCSTETGFNLLPQGYDALHSFVKKINHGEDQFSDVLTDLWKHQIEVMHFFLFSSDCISVFNFLGPVSKSTVLHGLLLKVEDSCLFPETLNKPRALFISGSIKMDFMHLGFSPSVHVKSEKSPSDLGKHKFSIWKECCLSLLQELQVTILFVQGSVDVAIVEYCREHTVSVLSDIPWQKFKLLTNQCRWHSSTYLLDCSEKDIISDMKIEVWKSPEMKQNTDYVLVSSQNQHVLQTALLYHPTSTVQSILEHQFWHNVSRLHLATKAGVVLPGNGRTETWCVELLQGFKDKLEKEDEKEITAAVIRGFSSFSSMLSRKTYLSESEEECLDEISCKIQAWNASLALVFITLNSDMQFCNQSDEADNKLF